MTDVVRVEQRGTALVITLARPEKRNAINAAMVVQLDKAFEFAEANSEIRSCVLQAEGPVFSAGTDLHVTSHVEIQTKLGGEYGVARRERTKPLIAVVEGAALGGGFELVLAADMVVATHNAYFGFPEVRRGLIPSCGGLFRGPHALPRNIALELLICGTRLCAERAYELGLVNRLVNTGQALESALELSGHISAGGPDAVRIAFRVARKGMLRDEADGWVQSDAAVAEARQSPQSVEGVGAFFERRSPDWILPSSEFGTCGVPPVE